MSQRTSLSQDVPRAVLDTSVLVGEQREWLWPLARDGYFAGVWSTFIVGELVRVRVELAIARSVKRSVYRERVNALVHRLSDVLTTADYRSILLDGALSDPDDDPILAAALASGAQYIVSLNTKDFPSNDTIMHVRFITPTNFLMMLDELYLDANIRGHIGNVGR